MTEPPVLENPAIARLLADPVADLEERMAAFRKANPGRDFGRTRRR